MHRQGKQIREQVVINVYELNQYHMQQLPVYVDQLQVTEQILQFVFPAESHLT